MGLAPLKRNSSTVSFMGDADTCDYQDFITLKGAETAFINTLLDHFEQEGIKRVELRHLRPESVVLQYMLPIAISRGYSVKSSPEAVTSEIYLPSSWNEYLGMIGRKQRHEVRRKLRRLSEVGNFDYFLSNGSDSVNHLIQDFLHLFNQNGGKKAAFMTYENACFFKLLSAKFGRYGLMRFGCLNVNSHQVAMIMVFDYNNTIYLYNSAYHPSWRHVSAGLVSKAMGIKEAIGLNRSKWEFLKGEEKYKRHLGGQEVKLYSMEIKIN